MSALSLRAKGIILVGLLLVLEGFFCGTQFYLLDQADREAEQQEQTKKIIAKASQLLQDFIDSAKCMFKYAIDDDTEALNQYERYIQQIHDTLARLKVEVSADRDESQMIEIIDQKCIRGKVIFNKVKEVVATEPRFVAAKYVLTVRLELEQLMADVVNELTKFHASEWKKRESTGPARMQRARDLRWTFLLAGVLVNIVMAVLLIRLFVVDGITSRLAVLLDNADRLRERRMLRAPLTGDDEIATLDKAFHEMWHSLKGEETLVSASQEQLRAIVDQMPIGLMITVAPDQAELIEYANPTLERLLAFDSGGLQESPLAEHFSLMGTNNKPSPLTDTGEIEGVVRMLAYKKDGSEVPIEFSVTDVSLSSVLRRLATVIDITDKFEVEKMKQAFVSMISHELRTPLTSVAGFLQLLPMGAYGPFEAPAVEAAAEAEANVEQLITLINDLLDLEKLEAGKLELSRKPVVLEEIIDAAIDTLYELIEKKRAQVTAEGCQKQIVGDGPRLQQAFTKLIAALLQLSGGGEAIKIVAESAEGKAVRIAVYCSKVDIGSEKLQTIFEPFQQFDVSSGSTSLGLGLPLARAIIVGHGGSCGARKIASGGTSLWMHLPNLVDAT